MWYKVRELQSKGLNKTQIGKHLGVDRSTVRRYLQMSREDFVRRRNSHRKYTLKLAGYEEYVRGTLEEYPYISAARIHDWLKECYPDFPKVCDKTVFNFVFRLPICLNSSACSRTVFLLRQQQMTSLSARSFSNGKKQYPLAVAASFSLRA